MRVRQLKGYLLQVVVAGFICYTIIYMLEDDAKEVGISLASRYKEYQDIQKAKAVDDTDAATIDKLALSMVERLRENERARMQEKREAEVPAPNIPQEILDTIISQVPGGKDAIAKNDREAIHTMGRLIEKYRKNFMLSNLSPSEILQKFNSELYKGQKMLGPLPDIRDDPQFFDINRMLDTNGDHQGNSFSDQPLSALQQHHALSIIENLRRNVGAHDALMERVMKANPSLYALLQNQNDSNQQAPISSNMSVADLILKLQEIDSQNQDGQSNQQFEQPGNQPNFPQQPGNDQLSNVLENLQGDPSNFLQSMQQDGGNALNDQLSALLGNMGNSGGENPLAGMLGNLAGAQNGDAPPILNNEKGGINMHQLLKMKELIENGGGIEEVMQKLNIGAPQGIEEIQNQMPAAEILPGPGENHPPAQNNGMASIPNPAQQNSANSMQNDEDNLMANMQKFLESQKEAQQGKLIQAGFNENINQNPQNLDVSNMRLDSAYSQQLTKMGVRHQAASFGQTFNDPQQGLVKVGEPQQPVLPGQLSQDNSQQFRNAGIPHQPVFVDQQSKQNNPISQESGVKKQLDFVPHDNSDSNQPPHDIASNEKVQRQPYATNRQAKAQKNRPGDPEQHLEEKPSNSQNLPRLDQPQQNRQQAIMEANNPNQPERKSDTIRGKENPASNVGHPLVKASIEKGDIREGRRIPLHHPIQAEPPQPDQSRDASMEVHNDDTNIYTVQREKQLEEERRKEPRHEQNPGKEVRERRNERENYEEEIMKEQDSQTPNAEESNEVASPGLTADGDEVFMSEQEFESYLRERNNGVTEKTRVDISKFRIVVVESKEGEKSLQDSSTVTKVLTVDEYNKWKPQQYIRRYANPIKKKGVPPTLMPYGPELLRPNPKSLIKDLSTNVQTEEIKKVLEFEKRRRMALGDDDLLRIPEVTEEMDKKPYGIPNIIHFIWFSCHHYRVHHLTSMKSALDIQKPRLILLHTNCTPEGAYWDEFVKEAGSRLKIVKRSPPEEIWGTKIKRVEHQSDVARLEILLEVGGIYMDDDVVILKSLNPLRNHEMVMGEENYDALANSILLASKNAWFLRRWYQEYRNFNGSKWSHSSCFVPWSMWILFPSKIHVVREKMLRPNWEEIKYIYHELWDWSNNYSIHLYSRFMKALDGTTERSLKELAILNTTYGEISRYILWGDKKPRDISHLM